MIRVSVVAASVASRVGLRVLLSGDDIEVVGEGARLDELGHAPLSDADVAVVQGSLVPRPPALPARLRGVLWLLDDGSEAAPPVSTTAWGALPSDSTPEELIAAVRALYSGLFVVHSTLAPRMLARQSALEPDAEPPVEPLTARELEVLQLIGQGLANKQIADRLHISEHTVKFHVSAIYAKLNVAGRTEAVRSGARRGLIVL
jgi:DNA-binding NarL/FixJ family response regulator